MHQAPLPVPLATMAVPLATPAVARPVPTTTPRAAIPVPLTVPRTALRTGPRHAHWYCPHQQATLATGDEFFVKDGRLPTPVVAVAVPTREPAMTVAVATKAVISLRIFPPCSIDLFNPRWDRAYWRRLRPAPSFMVSYLGRGMTNKIGEIVMARRPPTDLEASKGGERSVLAVSIVSACLVVALVLIGLGVFDGKMAPAPPTPQPATPSPAPSGSTNP